MSKVISQITIPLSTWNTLKLWMFQCKSTDAPQMVLVVSTSASMLQRARRATTIISVTVLQDLAENGVSKISMIVQHPLFVGKAGNVWMEWILLPVGAGVDTVVSGVRTTQIPVAPAPVRMGGIVVTREGLQSATVPVTTPDIPVKHL